jgi:Spy/CpxP family protein refolding chaperone
MATYDSSKTVGSGSRVLVKGALAALGAGVITLALVTTAWAMPMGGEKHRNPEKIVEKMADKLELDESQQASVMQIFQSTSEAAEGDRQRMAEIRQRAEASGGELDSAQIEELSSEVGELVARMMQRRLSAQAEVYALLNDEQREEFLEIQQHRSGKRKLMRRHRMHH